MSGGKFHHDCCCSVTQSCLILCNLMDCSMPGFPVLHHLLELAQTHVLWVGMPSNHLILCSPHLLLPSMFPSIKVFSNELARCIRWPKYWNFSFSNRSSNEYSRLIYFRIDRFDLCSPRDSQVFSNITFQKHQFLGTLPSLLSSSHIHTWPLEKS